MSSPSPFLHQEAIMKKPSVELLTEGQLGKPR